jgi:hypothetical protein
LKDSAPTVNAIFDMVEQMPQRGSFSFPCRFLKDPVGKSLVVMHYFEKLVDMRGQASEILQGNNEEWQKENRQRCRLSNEELVRDFEDLIELFPSLPASDLESMLQKGTEVFSAFPVLFSSLLLNSRFRSDPERALTFVADSKKRAELLKSFTESQANLAKFIEKIIETTEGHKFFSFPEFLEHKQCRQSLEDFREFLTGETKLAISGGESHSLSMATCGEIENIFQLRGELSARTQKGQDVLELLKTVSNIRLKWKQNVVYTRYLFHGGREKQSCYVGVC